MKNSFQIRVKNGIIIREIIIFIYPWYCIFRDIFFFSLCILVKKLYLFNNIEGWISIKKFLFFNIKWNNKYIKIYTILKTRFKFKNNYIKILIVIKCSIRIKKCWITR